MNKQEKSFNNIFIFLKWLSTSLFFVFFISIFLHRLISFNQDLGRHLKIGEIIFLSKSVPKTNLFSSSFSDFPFINHHWLPELVYYLSNLFFGLNSLIILKILLVVPAFFILFLLARKKSGLIISLSWGLLILMLFSQRTEVRPEIFSYFFLSIFLWFLEKKKVLKKFYYLLPLCQIFWVNSHIYFFLGPMIVLFYLLNHIVKFKVSRKKELKLIAFTFFLVSLATLMNPNIFKGAFYPLYVFKNYGYQVVENQSFFYMSRYTGKIFDPLFLTVFLLSFASFIITIKKQTFYTISSFIFFSILGFLAIRNIPIFALGMLIPVCTNLSILFIKIEKKINLDLKLNLKLFFYFLFIMAILLLTYQRISNQYYIKKLSSKRFGLGEFIGAENGVDFVIKNNIKGPVFNNFDIGSFLIYRLYPEYKVFVDGRPEAYPAEFLQNIYIPAQMSKDKWQEVLKNYNFNFIFFSHTDITPWSTTFLPRIVTDKDWLVVYLDDYVIILVKNNSLNKDTIEKYALDKNNFSYSCSGQIDCYARIKRILNLIKFSDKGIIL
ncbi:hypothetical protein ACFLZ1_00925 [Patescibacteria group bacterium]